MHRPRFFNTEAIGPMPLATTHLGYTALGGRRGNAPFRTFLDV